MTESELHMFLYEELKAVGVVTIGLAGVTRRLYRRLQEEQ